MTPGQKILLQFIGEAESGNNYDRVFGDHPVPGPITAMTVSALLALQAQWGREYGSSAAGYLQFMGPTLQSLIAAQQLAGSEIFSPAVQDRLGVDLLLRRGWNAFAAKTLALESFAKNLAEEWASMPVLQSTQGAHRIVAAGETYYAGDRLNRALVPPGAFRATLAQALQAG